MTAEASIGALFIYLDGKSYAYIGALYKQLSEPLKKLSQLNVHMQAPADHNHSGSGGGSGSSSIFDSSSSSNTYGGGVPLNVQQESLHKIVDDANLREILAHMRTGKGWK